MKDISIIIVNYNVIHFLDQALYSVYAAQQDLDIEVFVVDNNSVDESVQMVESKYPKTKVIQNNENVGFSKANNQAIRVSEGKYALLLNPDTIIQEDTLQKCFEFMESNSDAGSLGVRMIDGSGSFLPESKRGFPGPFVAFTKSTGLSSLFPKSKFWNQYHLLYLDEFETNPVDVLCGAFMFMRRTCLDEVGLLDEDYFMYGEDIDLSYRIQKGGYKNYYFPETSIIHFKGESTKKGSLNYVKTFYNAMIIFAKKHFKRDKAGLLVFFLQIAIFGRATLSIIKRFSSKFLPPILEGLVFFLILNALTHLWALYYHQDSNYYSNAPIYVNFTLYAFIWIISLLLGGGYKLPMKIFSIFRSIMIGSISILVIYGLLETDYRSSRAIILLGSLAIFIASIVIRLVLQKRKYGRWIVSKGIIKKVLILGSTEKANEIDQLLNNRNSDKTITHTIDPYESNHARWFEHPYHKLKEFIRIYEIQEVILSVQQLGMERIMQIMTFIGPKTAYKIAGSKEMSIVGSPSKNSIGELYTFDIKFNIDQEELRVKKRLLDVITATLLLVFSPLLLFFITGRSQFLSNSIQVLFGSKSWVGYNLNDTQLIDLPKIKSGIITPDQIFTEPIVKPLEIHEINLRYAKEYRWQKDLELIWKNWKSLSNSIPT